MQTAMAKPAPRRYGARVCTLVLVFVASLCWAHRADAAYVCGAPGGHDIATAHSLAGWAADGSNLYVSDLSEDGARSVDFNCSGTSSSSDVPNFNRMDWPVTIIFMGAAWMDKVSADLANPGVADMRTGWGIPLYGRTINNGGGGTSCTAGQWCWSPSDGDKTNTCAMSSTYRVHVRLYAPGGNAAATAHAASYTLGFGFYVLGTTHIDSGYVNEGCPDPYWTGYSENAALWIFGKWNAAYGSAYAWYAAASSGNNAASYWATASGFMQSDGQMTWLGVQ
jgi:hypothetical protein